jgi:hypothetical protein
VAAVVFADRRSVVDGFMSRLSLGANKPALVLLITNPS